MKTKIIPILYVVFSLLCLSVTSCRKPILPGPMGPQGEKGDPGVKGIDGPKGDNGIGGGIGNVYYSDWRYYTFAFQASNGFWRAEPAVSMITNDILTKGTVIIYFKRDGLIYKLDYLTDTESITQRIDLGKIWLYSSFDPSSVTFRYIIIPGSTASGLQARSGIQIDKMSYQTLCKQLDIEP